MAPAISSPQNELEQHEAPPSKPARRVSKIFVPLLVGSGLIALCAFAAGVFLWPRPQAAPSLASVHEALVKGNPEEALALIDQLDGSRLPEDLPLGTVPYLQGIAMALLAEHHSGLSARELRQESTQLLRDALQLGLKAGQAREARLTLALNLYRLGRLEEAQKFLDEGDLSSLPPPRLASYILLWADLWARERPDKVVEFLDRFLESTPTEEELRDQLRLRKAWCAAKLGKIDEALATCRQVAQASPFYPRAKLIEGLFHLAAFRGQSRQTTDPKAWVNQAQPSQKLNLQPITASLAEAIRWDNLTCRVSSEAFYWLGVALAEAGLTAEAEQQFHRVIERAGPTPPAVAAAWALGELAHTQGKVRLAAGWFRQALELAKEAVPPEGFPLLDWDDWVIGPRLEKTILQTYRGFLEQQEFAAAVDLATALAGVVDESLRLRLLAEVYRAVGNYLSVLTPGTPVAWEKLPGHPGDASAELPRDVARLGRRYYRQAGLTYLRVASVSFTAREYPDYLWWAAECFSRGRSPRGVLRALSLYMEDQPVRRRPAALRYRGEALLVLGKTEEALRDLRACYTEYPRDSAAFEARLLAARALRELGQLDEAEALLRRNLDGQDLTPASREWRESLFELGEILLSRKAWKEADQYLAELVARYPTNPHAAVAQYLRAYGRIRQAQEILALMHEETLSALAAKYATLAQQCFREAQEMLTELRQSVAQEDGSLLPEADTNGFHRNIEYARLLAQIGSADYTQAYATARELVQKASRTPEFIPAIVLAAQHLRDNGLIHEATTLLDESRDRAETLRKTLEPGKVVPELSFWTGLIDLMAGRPK